MSKRVLFVDDEPLVLRGLERTLRTMRPAWDLQFAESGEKALQMLRATSFDVLVTDMRMPGLTGVQLLDAVCKESPHTVRIVLSGFIDHKLALECVGVAHQFLAKPCDTAYLRKTITRVTELGFDVHNESLLRVLAQMKGLPTLSSVYTQINSRLDDPNATPTDLGDIIATDMGLTAHLLKIVNSAFFGLAQRVVKPADAVAYLGTEMLRSIISAASLFQSLTFSGSLAGASEAIAHSRRVAEAARLIAQSERASRTLTDECFVAGLLHDIGKLALATQLPPGCTEWTITGGSMDDERRVFGTTHTEVGGYLLGLWGLPTPAVEAARLHHTPREADGHTFSSILAVHAADALVTRGAQEGEPSAPLDMEYLATLGLADRVAAWRATLELGAPVTDIPIAA